MPAASDQHAARLAFQRVSVLIADSACFRIDSASTMYAHIWTSYAPLLAAVADAVRFSQRR